MNVQQMLLQQNTASGAAQSAADSTVGTQEALQGALDKMTGWVMDLIRMLPEIGAALIILLVFFVLAKIVRRVVARVMGRITTYAQVNNLAATLSYIGVFAIGLFVALSVLGLSGVVTTLLAGAGVAGLALGFAFQDIAANFISGVILSVRRPFRVGDVLETNDHMGTVREINLRTTLINSFQGQVVIIPNKDVLQSPMINYSRLGRRRVDLGCGVAYGDDLEKAKQIALETINGMEQRDTSRDVDLYYNEFGDSSINFVIRFWVDYKKQTDFLGAQSKAIMRLKKAFDEADITIPFPIRTLDFGVVGGEKLSEVLPEPWYEQENGRAAKGEAASDTESAGAAKTDKAPS